MPNDIHTEPLLVEIAIEPKSKADQEKLGVALAKLAAEDPRPFRVSTDQESGQTILKGMDELHLDIKVDILKRTYKVDANIGAPQVAFRERVTQRVEHSYTHKKQTGGTGKFAAITIIVEPNEPGKGYELEVEDRWRRGAERIYPRRRKGPGERVVLRRGRGLPRGRRQGSAHRRQVSRRRLCRRSPSKSQRASASAKRCRRVSLVLLEPIMKVEVVTPVDCAGAVIRDLRLRRGQITEQDTRGDTMAIRG